MEELKEKAGRLFAAGAFERAGELYLALAMQSPDDVVYRLRHAECARRAGNTLSAVASFRNAAAIFAAFGDRSRARKALRVALELAPGHPELERELGALGQPDAGSLTQALAAAAASPQVAFEVGAPEPLVTNALEVAPGALQSAASELHRIDANTVAFRRADGSGWYLVHAASPVQVEEVLVEDELELDADDILEEAQAE